MLMIADDSRSAAGPALRELALHRGQKVKYFSADRLQVQPCTACGSCNGKTYGRCVLQDDMQQVLPHIVGCRALMLVSPVIFGGPGFHIKKIMDRITAVLNPRYQVSDGELVKGKTGAGLLYYMVGTGDNVSPEEQAAFLSLHLENAHIMSARGRGFLLPAKPGREALEQVLEEVLHGQA